MVYKLYFFVVFIRPIFIIYITTAYTRKPTTRIDLFEQETGWA